MFIYDAAMKYAEEGVGLIIIAGKEYGSGSSRDWAAKGVKLLGVRAVIAESFERIHRTNLVGMGVLPMQFQPGFGANTLGLTGRETYHIGGIRQGVSGGKLAKVTALDPNGSSKEFEVLVRVDTPQEVEYYRHGGILPYVLRQLAATA
jgi:aconitate hydratase